MKNIRKNFLMKIFGKLETEAKTENYKKNFFKKSFVVTLGDKWFCFVLYRFVLLGMRLCFCIVSFFKSLYFLIFQEFVFSSFSRVCIVSFLFSNTIVCGKQSCVLKNVCILTVKFVFSV